MINFLVHVAVPLVDLFCFSLYFNSTGIHSNRRWQEVATSDAILTKPYCFLYCTNNQSQVGNVVLFSNPLPVCVGPALQSLNFIRGTVGADTKCERVCVCVWWWMGVSVKDGGATCTLLQSAHTHIHINACRVPIR